MSAPLRADAAADEPQVVKPGRGTLYLMIARIIALGGGFGISVILARSLGPVQFGVYGVVMSVLTWYERVLAAGIPGATATLLPRASDPDPIERATKALLIGWSVALFCLCWTLAGPMAAYLEIESGAPLFRLASLDIPLTSLYCAYDGILSGRRRFAAQSLLLIVQTMTKLAVVVLLLGLGLSVASAFVAHLLGTLATVAYVLARNPTGWGPPSPDVLRPMIRLALPVGSYQIALNVLMNLSLWQLTADSAAGGSVVGYFAAATNLTRIFIMVPSAVTSVMYTSLSYALARGDQALARKYVRETVRFVLVLTAPACILLTASAGSVMALLFGAPYREGAGILSVLCIAYGGVAFVDIFFHMLIAGGRVRIPAFALVGMLPALAALNVSLLARMGGEGAALGFALCILACVAIGATVAFRHYGGLLGLPTLLRIGAACAVIAGPAWFVQAEGIWLLIKLGALGGLYGAVLIAAGELTWADVAAVGFRRPERADRHHDAES